MTKERKRARPVRGGGAQFALTSTLGCEWRRSSANHLTVRRAIALTGVHLIFTSKRFPMRLPSSDHDAARDRGAPFRPIAWGFYLLSLPLWVAVWLAQTSAAAWANALAAAVMTALGLLLSRRSR